MTGAPTKLQRLRRIAISKPARIGLAVFVLYLLAGFFGAPWLLQRQLPKLVGQHLGAKATVGEVRVNPLLFSVELKDLAIAEQNGLQALQVGRIFIDFETSSLLRWALTFREIRIEKPVINADLDARESLNLARLLAALDKPDRKPDDDEGLPRLLVHKLAIADGALKFTDHTLQPAAQSAVSPVNFVIEDVSTLADHRGEHRLSAKLADGGQLQWQGRLSLSPIESSGTIALKDVRLSTPWQFVRDHLTIAEPQGSGHFGVSYRFAYANGKPMFEADNLAFGLNDVLIAQDKGGAVLAKLATVAFEGGSFDLAKRSLAFKDIRVADGSVSVVLDEDSVPDWAKLVRPANGAPAPAPEAAAAESPGTTVAPWTVSLPNIRAGPLALALTDFSRTKPLRLNAARTELTLAATASVGGPLQAAVEGGILKLGDIRVSPVDEKDPPLTLESAEVSGIAVNLQEKSIRAGLARLSGGRTAVRRDAAGDLHLVTMFAPRKVQAVKELRKEGFAITLDRAEIAGYTVALTDETFQPAIRYDLEQVNAAASAVALPPKKASPVELSLKVRQGGTVRIKGVLDLLRESVDLRLDITDVALRPLDPALKRHTTLTLASGRAGASGRVVIDGKQSPPAIRYRGSAALADFDVQVAAGNEKLAGWKTLALNDIDLDTAKNALAIAQVDLAQPYAKLLINKDKSTNLDGIRRSSPAGTPAATAPAAPSKTAPMAVSVERVRVEGGAMDFSDFSLVLPFATHIKELQGSANGLSSSPDSRASLKFEGAIADYGLARAEGTLQPFAPKKFTDIAVAFRNVELTPMSPYSATFAGRKIASGKISLDLRYRIENSKLSGDNKMLLDQFTLGERVESPTAVNLPLDLAIALLTDSDGKIDLALPVEGDVDNPQFSYGHVIWQAIRTVLTRIVTAPFRALGSLFGSGAETLGDIVFDAGGARVLPTEREKLKRVAEGLQKRPQLKLQVQGTYHQENDSRALRARAVRADLAAREGVKLAPGEDPGPIGFDSAKTQRALENMLDARAGGSAAAQFAEGFRKSTGREGARVNVALALVGRGAGDRELYVAMHQRLVELQPLPPTALAELAKARADAITTALTRDLKLDPARIAGKPAAAVDAADKNGVPAKLSFEALK